VKNRCNGLSGAAAVLTGPDWLHEVKYDGSRFRLELSGFFTRRAKMAWKTPRIVEVSVGMEINIYACAARK
jgi:coenzyme PQQ precursor peptide PqqA